jgi:tetratricopeptide (TPR) repeat protein
MADELRARGNEAFVAKKFEEALSCYQRALDAPDASSPHLILSNLSATLFHLNRFDEALEAAEKAITAAPTFTKAAIRKGQCLTALNRNAEAALAFRAARALEPRNDTLWRMEQEALAAQRKADTTAEITSVDHFIAIFNRLVDMRVRLAVLANLWNASSPVERFAIFRDFLAILAPSAVKPLGEGEAAPEGVHISKFEPSQLVALPLDNYADVEVPSSWLHCYRTRLDGPQREQLFNSLWAACSVDEQRLIIADFEAFFIRPIAGDAASASSSSSSSSASSASSLDPFAGHVAFDADRARSARSSSTLARSTAELIPSTSSTTSATTAAAEQAALRLAHPSLGLHTVSDAGAASTTAAPAPSTSPTMSGSAPGRGARTKVTRPPDAHPQ